MIQVDCVWNVLAHAQKPDFVFRRNGRVHLNPRGRQFSRLLAAELCASAIVMLDTPCSEVVWRVLATHSIRQFPLHLNPCVTVCHHTSIELYHITVELCYRKIISFASFSGESGFRYCHEGNPDRGSSYFYSTTRRKYWNNTLHWPVLVAARSKA